MNQELVKVCGTTSASDVMVAARWHADSIGLICEPPGQEGTDQTVSVEQAKELARIAKHFRLKSVLLPHTTDLMDVLEMTEDVQPDRVQLGQSEDPALAGIIHDVHDHAHNRLEIAQVIHVDDNTEPEAIDLFDIVKVDMIHLDTAGKSAGGTGEVHDWHRSRKIAARAISRGMRVMLAGGLTYENVLEAVEIVDPDAVDVQTSIKVNNENDPVLINHFVQNARFALQRMRRRREYPRHDRSARELDYAAI